MPYQPYGFPSYQQQFPVQNQSYYNPSMQQVIQNQLLLNGKMVESIDNVKMTDIPMDGNSYYFPKADGTEIYTKRWLANGSTEIVVFKKIIEQEEKQEPFNFSEMETNIMDKLNSIDERFAKFEKGFVPKTTAKKEA